jgi:anti-sigma B factor antagonist
MNDNRPHPVEIIKSPRRLDAISAPKLKETVKNMVSGGSLKLVMDMEETVFIDNYGCQSLLSIIKTLTSQQGDIKLASLTPSVYKVLELMRLGRIIEIHQSVENAVESFS